MLSIKTSEKYVMLHVYGIMDFEGFMEIPETFFRQLTSVYTLQQLSFNESLLVIKETFLVMSCVRKIKLIYHRCVMSH